MQKVTSDLATDFSKISISCKKPGSDQMQTGRFNFRAENETTLRTNPHPFQMFLQQKDELCVFDLLDYLASSAQGRGLHENIRPIIQALDIILSHRSKLSLDNATPKQGKCLPQRPDANETFPLQCPLNTLNYLHGNRGFFASVRATTDRTLLNGNACVGALYKESHLDDLFWMFLSNQNPLWRNTRDSNLLFKA